MYRWQEGPQGLPPPPTPTDRDICFLNPGMTQTPITMWSVSRWDATAIRSATCSCSGRLGHLLRGC